MITPQKLHIHTRAAVKALGKAERHQRDKVAIPLHALAKQDKMGICALPVATGRGGLVKAGTGGEIHLTADDGLDALPSAGFPECHCTVKDTVVGQGHGVMPALLGAGGQLRQAAGAVQQAVFTVQVQVDKSSHGMALLSGRGE